MKVGIEPTCILVYLCCGVYLSLFQDISFPNKEWLRDIVRRNLWFGSVAQKTVILDYQEEQGLLDKKRSVSFTCDFARDECIYSNRLVSGIVIILMFMYKNQNELSKYPV